jgi:hypothetical protein
VRIHTAFGSCQMGLSFAETAMRYLIRKGRTRSTWMVWDREKRCPAEVDGRELVGLSRLEAEAAFGRLIGRDSGKDLPMSSGWQVTYSGVVVDCRDEEDAKRLARRLVGKGFRVSAGTIEGALAAHRVEPDQMTDWLLDPG